MSLKQIGQNSSEEFFETILYMTAYDQAREQISSFTKDVDNEVLKEAIEGAANVLVFGLVFIAIQKQSELLNVIFDKTRVIVYALLLTPTTFIKRQLRKFKGINTIKRMGFFGNEKLEKAQIANTVAILSGNRIRTKGVINSASNTFSIYDTVNTQKNTIYNREQLHMNMGNNMAGRYNETLLFKLLTKSFTPKDETLMKKILGRDTASTLNIEDLNQVADFMYTTDSNGNPIGLSEAFVDLVNGLGFLHNK